MTGLDFCDLGIGGGGRVGQHRAGVWGKIIGPARNFAR